MNMKSVIDIENFAAGRWSTNGRVRVLKSNQLDVGKGVAWEGL